MNLPNTGPNYVLLEDRGILAIDGAEARTFLQGLISNDIDKATPSRAIYAALLTAEGKYLHDFFIVEQDGVLLVDCEGARRDDLLRRLNMYKLRAQATIVDRSDEFTAIALMGEVPRDICGLTDTPGQAQAFHGGVAFVDPRHSEMGIRVILPKASAEETLKYLNIMPGSRQEFDSRRIALALPDSSRDMIADKSILLENGFDELHGIDWEKGCYVGQELTARTKHRGLIKKRLVPVMIEGTAPEPGTIIFYDDKDAGEMRTSSNGLGLALMRLEYLEKAEQTGTPLIAGDAKLKPQKPAWAAF